MWDHHASFAKGLKVPKSLEYVGYCQDGKCVTYRATGGLITVTPVAPDDLPPLPESAAVRSKPNCYLFKTDDKTIIIFCETKGHLVYCGRMSEEALLSAVGK